MENAFSYHWAVSRLTNDVTADYRTLHCHSIAAANTDLRDVTAHLHCDRPLWPGCLAKKHVLLAICFPTLQALGHNVCGPLAVHTSGSAKVAPCDRNQGSRWHFQLCNQC